MEALKKVIPFNGNQNNQESGQEPVSGQQGAGTATQPYDAGNRQDESELGGKAVQQSISKPESTHKSGEEPISGQQGEGSAAQPFDAGNRVDDPELGGKAPQHTTPGDVTPTAKASHRSRASQDSQDEERDASARTSTDTSNEGDAPLLVKTPTIGSPRWFINAKPFAKRPDSPEEPAIESATTTIATNPEQQPAMNIQSHMSGSGTRFPRNHLSEDVPPSQSAIVHEPVIDLTCTTSGKLAYHLGDDANIGRTDHFDRSRGKGKGKAALVEDNDYRDFGVPTDVSSTASNRSERIRPDSMVTDYTYPTAGTDASTIASSSRRSSGVMNIPHSKGKPITAGGVPLGLRAMQDREMRFSYMPIYEQPEQDYHPHTKSESGPALAKTQDSDAAVKGTPSSALRGSKRHDSVGIGEHGKKQAVTETPVRRMSVIQKARSFGRKVRHSIHS